MTPYQKNSKTSITKHEKHKNDKSSGTSSCSGNTATNGNGVHPPAASSGQLMVNDSGSSNASAHGFLHHAAANFNPMDYYMGHHEDHVPGCVFTGFGCPNNYTSYHRNHSAKVTGSSLLVASVSFMSYSQSPILEVESVDYYNQAYDQVSDLAGQGAQFEYNAGGL